MGSVYVGRLSLRWMAVSSGVYTLPCMKRLFSTELISPTLETSSSMVVYPLGNWGLEGEPRPGLEQKYIYEINFLFKHDYLKYLI